MAKKQKAEAERKSPSVVSRCDCSHDFQDAHYGKGRRLHTRANKNGALRCTVCGKERMR